MPNGPLSPSALPTTLELENADAILLAELPPDIGAVIVRHIANVRQAQHDATLSAERQRLLGMTPSSSVEEVAEELTGFSYDILAEEQQAEVREVAAIPNGVKLVALIKEAVYASKRVEIATSTASHILRAAIPILLAPEVAKREAAERELVAVEQAAKDDDHDLLALSLTWIQGDLPGNWNEEYLAWYRPGDWPLGEHRAMSAFLASRFRAEVAKREAAEKERDVYFATANQRLERERAAEAERARLREALEKYGKHTGGCRMRGPAPFGDKSGWKCDCGYDAALSGRDTVK